MNLNIDHKIACKTQSHVMYNNKTRQQLCTKRSRRLDSAASTGDRQSMATPFLLHISPCWFSKTSLYIT